MFSSWTTKIFYPKNGEKIEWEGSFQVAFFFQALTLPLFLLFFSFLSFLFFLFLGNHIASCHFFIPFFLRHLHCLFFFYFYFLGIGCDFFFFFTGCDFFWNMFFIFISNLGDFSFFFWLFVTFLF